MKFTYRHGHKKYTKMRWCQQQERNQSEVTSVRLTPVSNAPHLNSKMTVKQCMHDHIIVRQTLQINSTINYCKTINKYQLLMNSVTHIYSSKICSKWFVCITRQRYPPNIGTLSMVHLFVYAM